jgi:hypothetical protein
MQILKLRPKRSNHSNHSPFESICANRSAFHSIRSVQTVQHSTGSGCVIDDDKPESNPDCDYVNNRRYTTRVDAVLHCELKQVNAVQTSSIWIYIYRIEHLCKHFWKWPKMFFFAISQSSHGILRNWHGLRCRFMRVKPCRYGFDTVWTHFEIRLCMTVA